jgi:hypothetical protein
MKVISLLLIVWQEGGDYVMITKKLLISSNPLDTKGVYFIDKQEVFD